MLLELLTLFENFVLRIATVCNVHNILPPGIKNFPKLFITYILQTTEL